MKIIITVIVNFLIVVIGGAAVAYSGMFNVAAINKPSEAETALPHGIMRQSVRNHASGIVAPSDLATRAAAGADDFNEMCTTCHGAPGIERSEIGQGLHPQAPSLQDVAASWSPNELFWIVKNGVRMTGMPAFGPTHDDDRLWDIVAFVHTLPGMTAEAYAQKTAANENETPADHHHDHGVEHHHDHDAATHGHHHEQDVPPDHSH